MHGKTDPTLKTQLPTTGYVTKQYKQADGKETEAKTTEEQLAVHIFVTPPAEVKIAFGLTLALKKKFEFARLDVGITLPCYKKKVDAAFAWGKEWVAKRVQAEVAEIQGEKDTSII